MVRINKIYTRSGDDGQTGLVDGSRIPKDSSRVSAYGDVDELNSHLGLISTLASEAKWQDLVDVLSKIQNEIFDIGSALATPAGFNAYPVFKVSPELISYLEQEIDKAVNDLPALTSFVLPGGSVLNSQLHIARTVCRRAERSVIHLANTETVDKEIIIYLNRLSDFLFALCRAEAFKASRPEQLWVPANKRT